MAKVETVRLVDDLTGGDADETVDFGVDGGRFEIDLTTANAGRLRAELAPYLAAARPADTPGARRARARAATARTARTADTEDAARRRNRTIRVWAREQGYAVSERGRIPAEVVEAYHGRPAGPASAPGTVPPGTEPAPADGEAEPATPMAVRFSG